MPEFQFINLDLAPLHITKEGIANYYWPIKIGVVNEIKLSIARDLIDLIKSLRAKNHFATVSLEISYLHIANDLAMYAYALILSEHAKKNNTNNLFIPKSYQLTHCLIQNFPCPEFSLLTILKRAKSRRSKFFLLLRALKYFFLDLKKGNIKIKNIVKLNNKNIVYVFAKNEYIDSYIDENKKSRKLFFFKQLENIFYKANVSCDELNNFPNEKKEELTIIVENILSVVRNAYQTFRVTLPPSVEGHFRENIYKIFLYLDVYQNFLSKKELKCPGEAWMDTSSCVWKMLLSNYYKTKGGSIVRFSHATGQGHFRKGGVINGTYFCDLSKCDKFFLYSQGRLENITTSDVKDLTRPKLPELHVFPLRKKYKKLLTLNEKVKKVMYASTIFPKERPSFFLREYIYFDWVVRLLANVERAGYQITYKPHPLDKLDADYTLKIQSFFGNIVNCDSFENVYCNQDVIIVDYLASSILVDLIFSNVPFVYIDLGMIPVDDKMFSLLRKRASVITGWITEDNRVMIDWTELDRAIKSSVSHRNDTAYLNYFYNPSPLKQ